MSKKMTYVEMLKEQIALNEYDIKDFDYKGPMTEPIISYDGDGEMETNGSVADLLDKYYLKERMDEKMYQKIDEGEGDATDKEPERNEIVDGETPDKIDTTMDDFEDEILAGESDSDAFDPDDVNESLEASIIDRLIKEMEEEVGPEKPIETPKDEETKQAGTDFATEKDIDKVLEDIELELALSEADEDEVPEKGEEEAPKKGEKDEDEVPEKGEEEAPKRDEEKLDIDKGVKTEANKGMGPIQFKKVEDLEESFKIFLEELEDELGDKKEEKKDEEKKESKKDEEKDEDETVEECKIREALKYIFEEDEEKEPKEEKKDEDKKGEEKEEDNKTELSTEMIDLMLEELSILDDEIE